MATDNRYRLFAFTIYPESMPANAFDLIDDLHVKAFVSPLHDKDVYEDKPDVLKKPHYHVFLMFDGKKSTQQVLDLVSPLFGVTYVEVIQGCCSYARYLCHLDCENKPWKKIYPIDDVKAFGGADYLTTITTPKDLKQISDDMFQYVRANHIDYWWIFCEKAFEHPDWVPFLNKAPGAFIKDYLRSRNQFKRDRKFDLNIGH